MSKSTKGKIYQFLMLCVIVIGVYTKYQKEIDTVIEKVFVKKTSVKKDKPVAVVKETKTHVDNNTSALVNYEYEDLLPTTLNHTYHHTYYSIDYNEEHEQPNWVCYLLTEDSVEGKAKRRDDFREDPEIQSESATLKDYKRSGYDRGHLCPAADMKLNKQAMSETFYMSNMSPQLPGFNRGEWKRLEAKVRDWAVQEDSLMVVTGPVFKNNIEQIGEEDVTVPGYYYKVIYDLTPPQKMTAFLLPHVKKPEPYMNYQTTVDKVEEMTGIDFFKVLKDSKENSLEANLEW